MLYPDPYLLNIYEFINYFLKNSGDPRHMNFPCIMILINIKKNEITQFDYITFQLPQ